MMSDRQSLMMVGHKSPLIPRRWASAIWPRSSKIKISEKIIFEKFHNCVNDGYTFNRKTYIAKMRFLFYFFVNIIWERTRSSSAGGASRVTWRLSKFYFKLMAKRRGADVKTLNLFNPNFYTQILLNAFCSTLI